MSNFTFLKERQPILENLGRLAEKNLYIDFNTTYIKCGMFREILVMEDIKNNIMYM